MKVSATENGRDAKNGNAKVSRQGKSAKSNAGSSVAKKKEAKRSAASSFDGSQNSKRKYDVISDEDRLKLILLIKEFGMSCHKASKVLNIAYNNAKVIFRIYKNEQRIRQTPKEQKRNAKTIRADVQRERE